MTMNLSGTARARSRPIPPQREAWKVVNLRNNPLYFPYHYDIQPGQADPRISLWAASVFVGVPATNGTEGLSTESTSF
jgi:hypothetical protein